MERLFHRRCGPASVISGELGSTMLKISMEIGRQVGLLLDRRGHVIRVIVGSPSQIMIPDLGRERIGASRLRGLRLIHSHLSPQTLSTEDLTDLALLRLDLAAAVWEPKRGGQAVIQIAHINPDSSAGQAWTVLEPSPLSAEKTDFHELISGLESELARKHGLSSRGEIRKASLVHLSPLPKRQAQERLEELSELARTEMISAVDMNIYRGAPNPQSLLGEGRVKDLLIRAMAKGAEMLLFDQDLTPAQAKWISQTAQIPVMDRTQLILSIFARRAHSSDGKLKVELAQLKYQLPRVGLREEALSRIRGGIGMRGPGQTTAETLRRMIKDRIRTIEGRLDKLRHGREERRKKRKRSGIPQVAIIGYTNAGKSTLLNALTNSDVLVEDKLFATLDPTTRRIRYPRNMEVAVSDTVGFIRDLPEDLLDAFRSTLEELGDADLLLHVVDISSEWYQGAIETVEGILDQLGLKEAPRRLVFNKIDLLEPEAAAFECARHGAIGVSAKSGAGVAELSRFISGEIGRIQRERANARQVETPMFDDRERGD